MITSLFLLFLEVSLSTSLIVLILAGLSPLLNKRYAAKWKRLIWLFLAVQLLLPVQGPAAETIAGLAAQIGAMRAAQQQKAPADIEGSHTAPYRRIVVEIPEEMTTPVIAQSVNGEDAVTVLDIVAYIWAAGALAVCFFHLFSYLHYERTVKKDGIPVKKGIIREQLAVLSQELQIKRNVPAIVYSRAGSPMILGIIRPVLVLPKAKYSEEELFFIVRHELCHLKQHDVSFKLLLMAAGALHWFNPFIWIMRKEAVVDIELSCDERVIQGMRYADRKAYTETLFSMIHCRNGKKTVLSTQLYGGKQIMKKRFQNILRKGRKKDGAVVLACAMLLTIALGTMIGCSLAEEGQTVGETTVEVLNISQEEEVPGDDVFTDDLKQQPEDDGIMAVPGENEAETTILTVMKEGEGEEIPATLYVGDGYSIYLTDNDWQQYEPDAWQGIVKGEPALNGQVKMEIRYFAGETYAQIQERLLGEGYEAEDAWFGRLENDMVYKIRLYETASGTWGVSCSYIQEAEEGWGRTIRAMAETFAVSDNT